MYPLDLLILVTIDFCHDRGDRIQSTGVTYCNATFDSYLCWPPTPAGETAFQHCPAARLSDTSRLAFRRCSRNGLWMGRKENETSPVGWTNYTPCFPLEAQYLLSKVYDNERDAQLKFEVALRTRYMEIVGFSVSLIALIISLVIFTHYRSLRNNRTRIHKSLFGAMVVQVVIRLTLYIDQALIRSKLGDHSTNENVTLRGIDNMPYLCESSYILLEYAITVMFMWMLIEGFYLHNVVTANALRSRISQPLYYLVGWGLPVIVTALWAFMTAWHFRQNEQLTTCWYGYNFIPLYWILQGPRLAVVLVNFVFLLNIMRDIIMKLKQSTSNEIEKLRKAVRAALVLLPLLGITNALNMIEAPLGNYWEFAVWSYTTHFLRSFQGTFIAIIYCFLNGEVRTVIQKHYKDYKVMRGDIRRQNHSRDSFLLRLRSRSADKENIPSTNQDQNNPVGYITTESVKDILTTSSTMTAQNDIEALRQEQLQIRRNLNRDLEEPAPIPGVLQRAWRYLRSLIHGPEETEVHRRIRTRSLTPLAARRNAIQNPLEPAGLFNHDKKKSLEGHPTITNTMEGADHLDCLICVYVTHAQVKQENFELHERAQITETQSDGSSGDD